MLVVPVNVDIDEDFRKLREASIHFIPVAENFNLGTISPVAPIALGLRNFVYPGLPDPVDVHEVTWRFMMIEPATTTIEQRRAKIRPISAWLARWGIPSKGYPLFDSSTEPRTVTMSAPIEALRVKRESWFTSQSYAKGEYLELLHRPGWYGDTVPRELHAQRFGDIQLAHGPSTGTCHLCTADVSTLMFVGTVALCLPCAKKFAAELPKLLESCEEVTRGKGST